MKFEISRLLMLEAAKKVARVVPAGAPVEVLNLVHIECCENTGEVFLTATDMEVSIQQKLKASAGESGAMLVNPRILSGMASLLPDEKISFSSDKPDILHVFGGKCVYELNCMPAKRYPKPVMPFPEETVKLSGVCSLAKRTVFASAKDNSKPALQCVNLKLRHNAVHAEACDGLKMMLVRDDAKSPYSRDFLLPSQSLRLLASISKDEDVFEVGDTGNEIVFTRDNMMFSMRKIMGDFIDTGSIIKSFKPVYSAVTDAGLLKKAVVTLMVDSDNEPVNIALSDGQIILRRNSGYSEARTSVSANAIQNTPNDGYYYDIRHFYNLFQVIDGRIRLEIDARGTMLIKGRNEVYVQTSRRATAEKQSHSGNTAAA